MYGKPLVPVDEFWGGQSCIDLLGEGVKFVSNWSVFRSACKSIGKYFIRSCASCLPDEVVSLMCLKSTHVNGCFFCAIYDLPKFSNLI